ncbi:hypothetical protein [Rothia sp. (in: high G+C Gram-positive bacteria)]|uniref:hypothetical protein n=1 Tax=Rothia sp. (in: high G+C Gram-positive bacteria) TaxID=1885016 RepID=UPI0032165AB6
MVKKMVRGAVVTTFLLSALTIFSALSSLAAYLGGGAHPLLGYGGALSTVTIGEVGDSNSPSPEASDSSVPQETHQGFTQNINRFSQGHRVSILYVPASQLDTATVLDEAHNFTLGEKQNYQALEEPASQTALVLGQVPSASYEVLLPHSSVDISALNEPYRIDQEPGITALATPAVQPFGTGTYYLTTDNHIAIAVLEELAQNEGYTFSLVDTRSQPTLAHYVSSPYGLVNLLPVLTLALCATALILIYLLGRTSSMATALSLGASRYQAQQVELRRLIPGLVSASLLGACLALVYSFLAPQYSSLFIPVLTVVLNILWWVALIWLLLHRAGRRLKREIPC